MTTVAIGLEHTKDNPWKDLLEKFQQSKDQSFSIYDANQKIDDVLMFLENYNCKMKNNKKEMMNFLNSHINIIDYLYEAPDVIKERFGDVNLNLELVFDPEIDSDDGELFLNIETIMDVKNALNKLSQINKEWLIPIINKNIRKFNVDIEII